MSQRDEGGPAFPFPGFHSPDGTVDWPAPGMTLRDYFAAQALPAVIALYPEWTWKDTALNAYRAADAMLAARKEGA